MIVLFKDTFKCKITSQLNMIGMKLKTINPCVAYFFIYKDFLIYSLAKWKNVVYVTLCKFENGTSRTTLARNSETLKVVYVVQIWKWSMWITNYMKLNYMLKLCPDDQQNKNWSEAQIDIASLQLMGSPFAIFCYLLLKRPPSFNHQIEHLTISFHG